MTAGIWRSLGIAAFDSAYTTDVSVSVTQGSGGWVVTVEGTTVVNAAATSTSPVALTVSVAVDIVGSTKQVVTVTPDSPRWSVSVTVTDPVDLWWPVGWGVQMLYEVEVDVSGDGAMPQTFVRRS